MNNFSQSPIQGEILAEVLRGGLVESLHCGHLVMLNADGSIFNSKGAIDLPIYPRSSFKAIQAAAMVRSGLKLKPNQLAIVCGSHSGSAIHLEAVESILSDCGLDVSALQNTKDKPLGEDERRIWASADPTGLTQNCSGKHSGMLNTCVVNGWDTNTYLSAEHPLQLAIKSEFEFLAGEKISYASVDGCGAPLFAISTLGLARAFHSMTVSTDPVHVEVMNACRSNPVMVAGEGRLTTTLMRLIPGLFMKEGAEGVEVATLADGRTLVFKIMDGTQRAFGPLIEAALQQWGISTPDLSVPVLGHGEIVGSINAVL
jgi:L-asparaginase II